MRGKSERWKDERAKQPFLSLSLRPTRDEVQIDLLLSRCVFPFLLSSLFLFLASCLWLSFIHSFSLSIQEPFSASYLPFTLWFLLLPSFFVSPSAIFLLLLFLFLPFSCSLPSLFFLQRRKKRERERKHTKRKKLQERKERQKEQRRRISGEGEEWSGRAFLHPLNQRISIDFFPKKLGFAFCPKVLPNFSESMCKNYIMKNTYYLRINKKNICIVQKYFVYEPGNQV